MATKTKKTLIRAECKRPPKEIRDNHKLRTPWLKTKLAEINAQPGREAKVVGKGSYQEISVYKIEEVSGRVRYRGVCQFCGRSQVVKNNVIVLHGYKRPGDGYIFGECPGIGFEPLNVSDEKTQQWLQEAKIVESTARIVRGKAEEAEKAAYEAAKVETPDAAPRKLWNSWNKPTEEEKENYAKVYALWQERWPLTAAYYEARKAKVAADTSLWAAEENLRHFQYLIDSKILGKPLEQEIVV
jgi:hypothetical protein